MGVPAKRPKRLREVQTIGLLLSWVRQNNRGGMGSWQGS